MSQGHHIIPQRVLLGVFGSLIVLTGVTYGLAQINLGVLEVPVALAIASTKAVLVVMYFMALKYDNPVNTLTFAVGVIFVGIFITFTLFDTAFRGDIGNVSEQTVREIQREEEELQRRQEALTPEQLRVAPADFENAEPDPEAGTGADADRGGSSGGS
jgi:cytochrome c oxidase subunit 4